MTGSFCDTGLESLEEQLDRSFNQKNDNTLFVLYQVLL